MASKPEQIFHGNGVSPGAVLGQVLKLDSHNRAIVKIRVDDSDKEARRLQSAIAASKEQLATLRARLEQKVGREHSFILDVHLLMLEDKSLISEILANIRNNRANAEWAVVQATDRLLDAYESLEDEYFRERHSDIENVVERILLNLSGNRPLSWESLPGDLIVVSRDFNPSKFATMDLQKVRGLALESGGRTSHTAIISRGLGLPAVMGVRDLLSSVATGDLIFLSGDDGEVIVNPTPERIDGVRHRMEAFGATIESAFSQPVSSSTTLDGIPVSLLANTELPHEIGAAKKSGAEGIGLFRSEFVFFGHPHGFPSMEEQLATYRMLVREMSPHPVAVRTLDAGSEQVCTNVGKPGQSNPSMGLRGIRLSLRIKEVFQTQVEAILRAGNEGRIEIVLPMVSTLDEIRQAKAMIERVHSSLLASPGFISTPVPVGAMIEVPAAALSLEVLAKEVDYVCVGTNDLIQYMLAVDRGNPQVAYLFQPLHPAVLHCLSHIAEVSRKLNKPVRICGEISANPFFAVLLVGLGFTQLSMNPLSVQTVRRVIHEISLEESRRIAKETLTFVVAQEAGRYLIDAVSSLVKLDMSSYANEIVAPNGLAGALR